MQLDLPIPSYTAVTVVPNAMDTLSIDCTGLNYSVHYDTGYTNDVGIIDIAVALFCGQDCVSFSAKFSNV